MSLIFGQCVLKFCCCCFASKISLSLEWMNCKPWTVATFVGWCNRPCFNKISSQVILRTVFIVKLCWKKLDLRCQWTVTRLCWWICFSALSGFLFIVIIFIISIKTQIRVTSPPPAVLSWIIMMGTASHDCSLKKNPGNSAQSFPDGLNDIHLRHTWFLPVAFAVKCLLFVCKSRPDQQMWK